jgi:hypothetical protein
MPGKHEAPSTSRIKVWPMMGRRKQVKIKPNRPTKRRGTPKREPLAYAALAPIVVTLAGWLGFDLDGETAAQIIGAVVAVVALAHRFVTPVADPVVPPSDDVAVMCACGHSADQHREASDGERQGCTVCGCTWSPKQLTAPALPPSDDVAVAEAKAQSARIDDALAEADRVAEEFRDPGAKVRALNEAAGRS